jgi:hypothetical protein
LLADYLHHSQKDVLVPFRKFYRKKLNGFLETADDEAFIQLLWATDALQTGGELAAAPHLDRNYPKAAVTTDISDKHFIYKWELETLANEVLVTPKRVRQKNGLVRSLNTRNFETIAQITNVLRKLENAEDAHRLKDRYILREMARLANREFDWQRGYFNTPQLYRNAFIYGQGLCADYFKTQHGITVNQFTLVGFSLYLLLTRHPSVLYNADFSALGLTAQDLEYALALLASPLADLRALAAKERHSASATAYKPSVLRRFPCVVFGDGNSRVRAPLPQLILERITAGVFYDVVGGGGALRNDYGHRFEEYCLAYLRAMLPELEWRKETEYRVKGNDVRTPDILLAEGAGLDLAIECKATRMGYGAKFGEGDLDERGFEEIIKAVFQLWRFFSHCRRGLTGMTLNADAVGALLTLDSWLQMANPLQDEVVTAATQMAASKDSGILEQDQRPIAFFSITDLEATLGKASSKTFLQAVRAASTPKHKGWMLSSVHDIFTDPNQTRKPYPFRSDMGKVLPWWDAVEAKRAGPAMDD